MSPTSPPHGPVPRVEPVAAPRALGQRQVSRRMLAVAVLLIALGGALSFVSFYSATHAGDYLTLARAMPAGSTLRASDLRTVQVNAQSLPAVPASQLRRVVGKRTTRSMSKGQLLPPDGFTAAPILQAGQRQIGVKLDAGRMPAERLHPGDALTLVETAAPKPVTGVTTSSASSDDEGGTLGQWDATVVSSSEPSVSDGSTVVYVAVPAADAAQIGGLAVAERLVVLLVGNR